MPSRTYCSSFPGAYDSSLGTLAVVDVPEPLVRHGLREELRVAASAREVVHHVLNEHAVEQVVVLVRRALVEHLVVEARLPLAVEARPLRDDLRVLLRIVLLGLRVFDGEVHVRVVEVVLLNEGRPILIRVDPLRLGRLRDRRVVVGDEQRPRAVATTCSITLTSTPRREAVTYKPGRRLRAR